MRAGYLQDAGCEANFIAKAGEHLAGHFELLGFALDSPVSGF
jgi:hypothetical protein